MKCGYVKTINNLQFYFESSLAKKKKKMILDLIPRILGKLLLLHEVQKPLNH